MTTTEILKQEEQQERTLAILRRLVEEKREAERQAVEDYKNNPTKRALVAELDRKNAERGTPVIRL